MSSITIVNLTPHALDFLDGEDRVFRTIAPSGLIARCTEETEVIGDIPIGEATVDVVRKTYGELVGLPASERNTIYIASNMVMRAAYEVGRHDVYCPAELVRDENGGIVGCRALAGMAEK